MEITETHCTSILTRATGYLKNVSSHSLNPYIGCGYGNSSCGEGCYVRFNQWLNRGREWGRFVDVKVNADEVYLNTVQAERRWAARRGMAFSIFFSSSTDPWQPIEQKFRVTRKVLDAMLEETPDVLILQTHSSRIADDMDRIISLSLKCDLRVHLSIEGDRDSLPGLPPPPCSVDERIRLVNEFTSRGITTVVCMSPLYPLIDPDVFFQRIAESGASAVVIDHFIEGDGTRDGSRTRRTRLPQAITTVDEQAVELSYREKVAEIARDYLPVGISSSGFAGVYSLQVDSVSEGGGRYEP
ncbi:MAG: hypothetical protein QGI90_00735 [Nitrospinaceae bacterium]|nr:hypothetical protein [Nitrospinaceae bacterium]